MSFEFYDMVFEGGGAKGSAFVGALEKFFEAGLKPRRLVGTSAGAITAAFLAAGYTPQEMKDATNEKLDGKPRFSSFMDRPVPGDFTQEQLDKSVTFSIFRAVHFPFLPNWEWLDRKILNVLLHGPHYCQLFSFVECGGLFAGGAFTKWLHEKLEAKGIDKNITLGEFAKDAKYDLSLVVSDTTGAEMLVLNSRTAPDCPLAMAVRMSMSIPFVWREVVWEEKWGKYLGRDITGHIMVDGGALSNFPIKLIAVEPGADDFVRDVMGEAVAGHAGNIGFMIDENIDVPGQPAKLSERKHSLRTVSRVSRIVDTLTQAQDNIMIQRHEHEICRLPAKGYGTTEFDMDEARLDALVEAGRRAMAEYLARMQGATTVV
ncbi:MAG TPA: patatin-like phospholipase family protein [Pyrinomonadaceae bacterium]|nr:patatin-like phospholipase family protein [Pyrinomonadaceae bacterium]